MPDLRADVVVANFPFGIHDWGHDRLAYGPRWTYGLPPRTEPELAWVQHALAHLSPDGTAVVLMPPAAATRPAGRRVRAELVRHGALRAVIALPAGLMPPTGIGLRVAGRSSSTGSGALRIDIKRLAIPVLPLDRQQAYGKAFCQLVEFRTRLDRAAATGAALAREIGDGLTAGTLGPPS